jgi:hydroxymethylbilane synthase
MPLVDVAELVISCVPSREDARDVLITRDAAQEIATLPPGARVGTGSLRRRCQLLERRPDLVIEPIRGNIETRLRKLNEGEYDAILLAFAGLKRAGLFDAGVMTLLDIETLTPAAGQGALALQTRRDDAVTIALLEPLHDVAAATAVDAERALVRLLEGDCHAPIAAFASLNGDTLTLRGALGALGGNAPVKRGQATVTPPDAEAAAEQVRQQIQAL